MQARPGPTSEPILRARPRRFLAATTILPAVAGALLASTPAPAAPTDTGPTAQGWGDGNELRELADLQRAHRARHERPEPPAVVAVPETTTPPPAVARARHRAAVGPRRVVTAPFVAGDIAAVIRFALAQIGEPYRYGAAGPGSWDCSGLLLGAFAQIGIRLPHSAAGIGRMGRAVSRSQLRPGDVVVYGGHVGIALDAGRMIHAPHTGTTVKIAAIYGSPIGYRRLVG